jgi:hypothetical protein
MTCDKENEMQEHLRQEPSFVQIDADAILPQILRRSMPGTFEPYWSRDKVYSLRTVYQ